MCVSAHVVLFFVVVIEGGGGEPVYIAFFFVDCSLNIQLILYREKIGRCVCVVGAGGAGVVDGGVSEGAAVAGGWGRRGGGRGERHVCFRDRDRAFINFPINSSCSDCCISSILPPPPPPTPTPTTRTPLPAPNIQPQPEWKSPAFI